MTIQGKFRFEKFTDPGKSFSARATIRQNAQIGFNEGARNLFNLEEFTSVVLFFDREARVIGIRLTNDEKEEGAIPIHCRKQNCYIGAKAFLDRFAISYKNSQRFALEKDGDFLVIDLKNPTDGDGEKE